MTHRLLLILAGLCFVAGCEPSRQTAEAPMPEEVGEPTAPDTAGRDPESPATYQVLFETTKGDVVIDVDRELAPRGADRFYRLVKEGFYDEAKFFRIVPDFIVQVGMAADPEVHAKWGEANFRDDPVKTSNTRGTVTFAKTGMPHSRSSQIFINLGDNTSSLDPQGFAPFGKVLKGMDVVDSLNAEYGERPDQGRIAMEGNAYLDAEFPNLDGITSAKIISENGEATAEATSAEETQPEAATPEVTGDAE